MLYAAPRSRRRCADGYPSKNIMSVSDAKRRSPLDPGKDSVAGEGECWSL